MSEDTYNIVFHIYSDRRGNQKFATKLGQFETRPITDKELYPVYKKCVYIVRNRMRILGEVNHQNQAQLERLVSQFFEDFDKFLYMMFNADIVEVELPFERESLGWSARLFPWEEMLTLAVKRSRSEQLLVVRKLRVEGRVTTHSKSANASLLRVESVPGEFAEWYDFSSESNLVEDALDLPSVQTPPLENPTVAEFHRALATNRADIVHLAAVDTIYAENELEEIDLGLGSIGRHLDGVVFRNQGGSGYDVLHYSQIENLIQNAEVPPALFSFATCYSADRLAPLAVGGGAHASIGFRDIVYDDVVSEYFRSFYSSWRESNWNLLAAFRAGLRTMRSYDWEVQSVPVIYTDHSVIPVEGDVPRSFSDHGKSTGPQDEPESIDPQSDIRVRCKVHPAISYCSLHNYRPLFQAFEVRKKRRGKSPPLDVCVEFTANGEREVWRRRMRLKTGAQIKDLARNEINIALGAKRFRTIQESTRATVTVTVECGEHTCYQDTHSVTLLPIDQWHDTRQHWQWLPSFVQPRDPAVLKIISRADKYLKTLLDDNYAGFDGYQQSYDFPEIADIQVRAIWSALSYDIGPQYINPPPSYLHSYSEAGGFDPYDKRHEAVEYEGPSQRIRVPSQILNEGRGTCIDLALLFTSCLEYVGIYPVIILIAGHAFPGWWRSDEDYHKFGSFGFYDVSEYEHNSDADEIDNPERHKEQARLRLKQTRELQKPWVVERTGFREISKPISEGALTVIETVKLSSDGRFAEAIKDANSYLSDPRIFDALIDIQRARTASDPVTPLPIIVRSHD